MLSGAQFTDLYRLIRFAWRWCLVWTAGRYGASSNQVLTRTIGFEFVRLPHELIALSISTPPARQLQ
jgi:hypothetical protein